jgi:hypothetical protein
MGSSEPVQVFRTGFARVIAVLVVGVCAVALIVSGISHPASVLQPGWVFGCAGIVAWIAFWRPHVEISDGEIVLANIVRTVAVPWVRVTAIDSRWSLTIHTSDRRYQSWASPGSSGMAARGRMIRPRRRGAEPVDDRDVDLRGAEADAVALAAAERMTALREAGYLGAPRDDIPVTRRWEVPALIGLAVGAVWAAAGLLL